VEKSDTRQSRQCWRSFVEETLEKSREEGRRRKLWKKQRIWNMKAKKYFTKNNKAIQNKD
jgi:hypothetical protein